MSQTSPVTETLPEWEDADVQLVYEMLCDPELNSPPNPEEHWEGWVSRNIVRGLRSRWYAQCPQERLAEAERVIRGVVTSYPVAAGTSKYGFEDDHDGYGSIRECRLYMERFAVADTSTDRTDGYRGAWLEMIEHCNKLKEALAAAHAAFEAIPIGYPLQQNGRTIDHTLLNEAKRLCELAVSVISPDREGK